MRARRAFAVLLLTASLGLAGCAGGSDSGDGAQSAAKPAARDAEGAAGSRQAADEAAGAPAEDGADRDGAAKPSAPPSTHVIRTATLEVEVEDATKALAAARRAAGNAGGHVENESTERIDDTHVTSNVVLRVPQERYESVLAELAGAGKLLSRTADAKDVTGQVVDVESRIATQRASVARVRELMDRATRLSDVVTLEAELSTRQADLESLLAQQATLKDRTSLATITLTLSETTPEETAKEDDGPGFLDALGGGWDALVATLHWIAVAVGAVAPFAALGA
ncbi:lipoprotein, partial [Streptomyces pristinaespiralis ATCC 25486]